MASILPGEYHIPGYNFCGPGTQYSRRIARGDQPINALDACCMIHDGVYHETTDKTTRVKSDHNLSSCARRILFGAMLRGDLKLAAEAELVVIAMATEPGNWI